MKKLFFKLVATYLIGTIAGAILIFVFTLDFETIPAGALAPVCLLPSIILYVFFETRHPDKWYKYVGFFVPFGIIFFYFLNIIIGVKAGYIQTSDLQIVDIGLLFLVCISGTGIAEYFFLKKLDKSSKI